MQSLFGLPDFSPVGKVSLSHRGRERVGWLDPGDTVVRKEISFRAKDCQEYMFK